MLTEFAVTVAATFLIMAGLLYAIRFLSLLAENAFYILLDRIEDTAHRARGRLLGCDRYGRRPNHRKA